MKKAAIALDGDVHDFGDYALLVNEHEYLTALFEPDQLKEVLDNPGNYVSFEVYPK